MLSNYSSSNGLEKCPKLRFPGFDEPWKSIAFGDLVHEYSDRTKEENEDTLLSAAIEGMFLNTELFGHQRGASNKGYKKIKHGTMVLSTQNLHLGNANVNQRFEHGMVSPAYKTYDIIGCSVDLIAQWIKSDAAKRFFYNATTVGASVCRRNVEWDTLYEQSLYLPCRDEQEKVAKFLALLSNRINKQQQFVAALKKYKRGAVDGLLAQKIKFPTSDTW
ncbi:restriction endonuclease subunit S, partial [Holdemania filiformis]